MIAKVSMAVLMTVLVIGAAGSSSARAQQKVAGGTLTAADYVEIQQLVSRYSYAVDTHADNGYAYADLFAPDGVFGTTKGREALAELARTTQKDRGGPSYTRHYLTNVIIFPTPEGARGSQYLMAIDVSEGGKPSSVVHGGRYDDLYVKTARRVAIQVSAAAPRQDRRAPAHRETAAVIALRSFTREGANTG